MEDILNSIKAFLYDRSVSPLFGAFVTAWAVCNYRVLVILFSSEKYLDKFKGVNEFFAPEALLLAGSTYEFSGVLLHGILYPLIGACFYLFIYPTLAAPVYRFSLRKQGELRQIRQDHENTRLLSAEESREIYKRLADMQEMHETSTEFSHKQIIALNETINQLNTQLSSREDPEIMEEKYKGSIESAKTQITDLKISTDQLQRKIKSMEDAEIKYKTDIATAEAKALKLKSTVDGLESALIQKNKDDKKNSDDTENTKSKKFKFLSSEWFSRVSELNAKARDINAPPAPENLKINLTITRKSADSVDMCLNGGYFEKGLNPDAPTKLTMPESLARRMFLDRDQSAGMQGFMSGQIRVEGDMSKLMAMQSARPSEEQNNLIERIKDETEKMQM
jgi:putative sterol carrier protein